MLNVSRVAAVVLFALSLAACGDDDAGTTAGTDETTTTTTGADESTSSTTATTAAAGTVIEVEYADGSVVGGAQRHAVSLFESVTIRVTSDVAEEVHVHGYDLTTDLEPGVAAEITFSADIPGVFEVELEVSHKKLLDLEVS